MAEHCVKESGTPPGANQKAERELMVLWLDCELAMISIKKLGGGLRPSFEVP